MNFNWNQSLATGNEAIDSQHQELFRRLELLVESSQSADYSKKVSDAVSFLENYIFRHFTAEEMLQSSNHYPEFEKHQKEHREFLTTVANLRQEFNADGSSQILLLKSIAFLGNWITNHVLQSDKDLATFLQGGEHSLRAKMKFHTAAGIGQNPEVISQSATPTAREGIKER
jgi:hemerythrin